MGMVGTLGFLFGFQESPYVKQTNLPYLSAGWWPKSGTDWGAVKSIAAYKYLTAIGLATGNQQETNPPLGGSSHDL